VAGSLEPEACAKLEAQQNNATVSLRAAPDQRGCNDASQGRPRNNDGQLTCKSSEHAKLHQSTVQWNSFFTLYEVLDYNDPWHLESILAQVHPSGEATLTRVLSAIRQSKRSKECISLISANIKTIKEEFSVRCCIVPNHGKTLCCRRLAPTPSSPNRLFRVRSISRTPRLRCGVAALAVLDHYHLSTSNSWNHWIRNNWSSCSRRILRIRPSIARYRGQSPGRH
jgi:hypothetical protein